MLAVVCGALGGCDTGDPQPEDLHVPGEGAFELGVLDEDGFVSLTPGDEVWVHPGLQGAHHVLLALRMEGEPGAEPLELGLSLRRAADGHDVTAASFRVADTQSAAGVQVIISDPGAVRDQLVVVEASLGRARGGEADRLELPLYFRVD